MVVVYSISMLIFYWPLSFAFAISALIGGSLGQGNVKKAKKVLWFSIISCFSVVILIIIILNVFTRRIVAVYTFKPQTQGLAEKCLKAYSFAYGIDAI